MNREIKLNVSQSRGYEKVSLEVKGTQNFLDRKIPVIYGGFGSNQKVVFAKTIAEIHGMETKHVNELINNNFKRFKDKVDVIDVINNDDFKVVVNDLGLKGSNRTKNIYLLSERGYAKLIKIMDSDLAWEIHDKLMDEYFSMREERENPYAHLSKEFQALIMHDEKIVKLEKRVDEIEDNAYLSPSEYGMVGQKVNNKIHTIINERGLTLNRQQRSELYKSLNRDIKVITGVHHRCQLRRKHLNQVLEFIYRWEPSLATMMKVEQMSLAI